MRRTKNRFDVQGFDTKGISGCRLFEGEDLAYQERIARQKEQQKEFIKEQLREKRLKQMREKQEEDDWATQEDVITRVRGMLEDEMSEKRFNMNKKIQEENVRLAILKKQKEEADREWHEMMNARETYRD